MVSVTVRVPGPASRTAVVASASLAPALVSSSAVTVTSRFLPSAGRVDGGGDTDRAVAGEHVDRAGEHVGEVDRGHHLERDVPVEAGRLQVVDRVGAAGQGVGRHVEPAAVDDHREHVGARLEVAGEFDREREIAARVAADGDPVEHDGGVGHHPVEGEQDAIAAGDQARAVKVLAVDPALLPVLVAPVGPGQRDDRVRHGDRGEAVVVVPGPLRAGGVAAAEQPALVEVVGPERGGDRPPAGPPGARRPGWRPGQQGGGDRQPAQRDRARAVRGWSAALPGARAGTGRGGIRRGHDV